jgi:hypothetical protein
LNPPSTAQLGPYPVEELLTHLKPDTSYSN